jgi:uncharacterized protein YecE (DUF72 family)
MKKLKEPQKNLSNFLNAIHNLNDKLGSILFQLPPNWHMDVKRLKTFLTELPSEHRYVLEFRDSTWFDESVYKLLSVYNVAFCIYDLEGKISPEVITSDFVYIRLHGPDKNAYQGSYSKRQLTTWANKFNNWAKEGKEIYCFFDNDQKGYAAKNALTLRNIFGS